MRNAPGEQRGAWAQYVKAIREATGVSRAELARRLGVDPTTVWRWETGRQKPESPAVPQALAELFRLDLDGALAAAGLRPGVEPPAQPAREYDEELERILTADVDEEMRLDMIAHLAYLREVDKQRRMKEIEFHIKHRRRDVD